MYDFKQKKIGLIESVSSILGKPVEDEPAHEEKEEAGAERPAP